MALISRLTTYYGDTHYFTDGAHLRDGRRHRLHRHVQRLSAAHARPRAHQHPRAVSGDPGLAPRRQHGPRALPQLERPRRKRSIACALGCVAVCSAYMGYNIGDGTLELYDVPSELTHICCRAYLTCCTPGCGATSTLESRHSV
eukprot:scaffold15240_cov36-Phaeocystis_antarctica.AAC.4